MSCDTGDFRYPMQAKIYYPMINKSAYGNIDKQWNFDRVFPCSLTTAGSAFKQEIDADVLIRQDSLLVGRFRDDLRISSVGEFFDMTNILITDIVDNNCQLIYKETSGPREGMGTLFEVSTQQPFINPFGKIEFYKVVLKRLENQGEDI